MAFINQELAQVPGCHVSWDLHNFPHAVFAEDLHDLRGEKQRIRLEFAQIDMQAFKIRRQFKWRL